MIMHICQLWIYVWRRPNDIIHGIHYVIMRAALKIEKKIVECCSFGGIILSLIFGKLERN